MGGDISVNNETFLVTDFMNLKIKLTQYFRCVHKNSVFIEVSVHTYMMIYVCTVLCF
jgi:hypothetical protein